ncbi:MAG: DnaA/Hda family protein [Bacteroidia bacterium]
MELWNNYKTSVCSFNTFDNYFNKQQEIECLKNETVNLSPFIISANSGNGVTHLLHAICNKWINENKNIYYIKSQTLCYFIKKIKSQTELSNFQTQLLNYDLIAIDNIEYFYKKTKTLKNFIFELYNKCNERRIPIIFGCSNPNKDFTKTKSNLKSFNLKQIELKPLNGFDVFNLLKNLCEHETLIPDNLIYVISNYNGTAQEYINCLISIRFKSKLDGIDLKDLSSDDIENQFNIKKYFKKQQFRKCLHKMQFEFPEKVINKF